MFNDEKNLQIVLDEFAKEMRTMFLDEKTVMVDILLYEMFLDNLWGAKVTFSKFIKSVYVKYSVDSQKGEDKQLFYAAEFLTDEELNNIVKSIKQERDE